jgi:O-antigen/teichoic acid export membrane protein
MRLSWNLFAGITNSAWTAIVGLAATPFYLKYLGIEAYGLVGFFITLLALLQLLDLGLSPAISREVARARARGWTDALGVRSLLRSLELMNWGIALLLGALVIVSANWIGRRWLQSNRLAADDVVHAIMLMGVVVAARWSIGLYMGALMGAQRVVVASVIAIAVTTISAVGAVFVLAFVSPTIHAFFVWQAAMGLVYVVVMRWSAWRALGGRQGSRFDREAILGIWRFSAGLTGVTFSGVILSQLDKVLLSRLVGLDGFGRYMLSTTLAGGLYLLVTPIFNVMYPRFSELVARDDMEGLGELYGLGTRFTGTLLFPVAATVALYASPLVHLWTGNAALATSAAPVVSLLILGSAIHGVMYFPYALQLAFGRPRLALTINAVLILLMVPLTVALTLSYAEIGAAIAWLILHICYLVLGAWLTHRGLLTGQGMRWVVRDIGIPLCASVFVIFVASRISFLREPGMGYDVLLQAGLVASAAMMLSLALSPRLRLSILDNLEFASRWRR